MGSRWDSLTGLVVVAAHAVLRPGGMSRVLEDEAWALRPFQRGEPPLYVEHVRAGVQEAAQHRDCLLVFSGGQTREDAGPLSESQSYFLVAEHFGWWSRRDVRARATTEEFARDSLENLLFAVCRFRECCGALPQRIVVVGWEFKRERFALHRDAIGFPPARWEYVGANDPRDLEAARRGEREHALRAFLADPMGSGKPIASKRRARNPYRRQHGYLESCPELRSLLLAGKTPAGKNPAW